MINPDNRDRLSTLTTQASHLAFTLYGEGGDTFRNFSDEIQDGILWLLSDLLREVNDIVNGEADHD